MTASKVVQLPVPTQEPQIPEGVSQAEIARLLRVEQLATDHGVRLARLEARLEAVEIDLQRRRR